MREKLMKKNEQTGFTIIEVVLVLAIAGLIFLIVFLALPQLQKSRRDTQRRADAGRMLAAMETAAGNNNGTYPAAFTAATQATFISSYLTNGGGTFSDPSTSSPYAYAAAGAVPVSGQMAYNASATGYICSTTTPGTATATGAQARNIAITVYQESGTSSCQDNQ